MFSLTHVTIVVRVRVSSSDHGLIAESLGAGSVVMILDGPSLAIYRGSLSGLMAMGVFYIIEFDRHAAALASS